MPSKPLPFNRKDFSKERKPSTTPSRHNHESSSSCRSGCGGGPSGPRRPVSEIARCVTPSTAGDTSSHKKRRLGWGEGLAKYEKKSVGSRSATAMAKLQVWKADVSRQIEHTESEIDSLENELKLLTGNSSAVSVAGDVHYYSRQDKLCCAILAANQVLANRASHEFSKLLPTTRLSTNNELLVKKKIAMKKHFLRFKERFTVLKFWAFYYSWKEDFRLLSIEKLHAKSQNKYRTYLQSLSYPPLGRSTMILTDRTYDYLKNLHSDSRVRIYRNILRMPCFLLDRKDRLASRFISDNRLVKNPIDVEKERSISNLWTVEEKEIFLVKYSLFRKDYKKIASFLQNKTVAACVEFYYKNHKSDLFPKTKKKPKLAKNKYRGACRYLITSA